MVRLLVILLRKEPLDDQLTHSPSHLIYNLPCYSSSNHRLLPGHSDSNLFGFANKIMHRKYKEANKYPFTT